MTNRQIVCNPPTYPNFLRFIDILKVPLLKTEMTFAISRDRGLFEWAGEGLGGIFCQIGNVQVGFQYHAIVELTI
jgi:predicted NAD/FAD-binding protein